MTKVYIIVDSLKGGVWVVRRSEVFTHLLDAEKAFDLTASLDGVVSSSIVEMIYNQVMDTKRY
jgi:hypothetical protein